MTYSQPKLYVNEEVDEDESSDSDEEGALEVHEPLLREPVDMRPAPEGTPFERKNIPHTARAPTATHEVCRLNCFVSLSVPLLSGNTYYTAGGCRRGGRIA